jgi:hypothetical protein
MRKKPAHCAFAASRKSLLTSQFSNPKSQRVARRSQREARSATYRFHNISSGFSLSSRKTVEI